MRFRIFYLTPPDPGDSHIVAAHWRFIDPFEKRNSCEIYPNLEKLTYKLFHFQCAVVPLHSRSGPQHEQSPAEDITCAAMIVWTDVIHSIVINHIYIIYIWITKSFKITRDGPRSKTELSHSPPLLYAFQGSRPPSTGELGARLLWASGRGLSPLMICKI